MPTSLKTVLVVEDSPEDFDLTVRAFTRAGFVNPLRRCADGEEALAYLRREGSFSDPNFSPRPIAILLDLNLPGTDGRAVLRELKGDSNLRTIPVIVVTTSKDERDVVLCYNSGANSFVHKPVNLEGFFETIQRLSDFWFGVALLPS
jgi:CheY-like chemotaxis protein